MPRVSVILPSYNHAEFVGEAIASVLAQSWSDLELVIVDDGSTDGSAEQIRAVRDERVVTHFQANQGAHAALNKGLELCSPSSEFACIINSDDVFLPDWVSECVRTLGARPEVGACAAHVEMFGQVGDERRRWYRAALDYYRQCGDVERALLRSNFIVTTSNIFFRKHLLGRTGGFRPLRYTHDLDFFLRLAASSGFQLLERELVRYRIHASNTIAETRQDESRLIYEYGWILAARIDARQAIEPDPQALFGYVSGLVLSLPLPESPAVALALAPLFQAMRAREGSAQELERRAAELLGEDSEVFRRMLGLDLAHQRKRVAALEQAAQERERVVADLNDSLGERERLLVEQGRTIAAHGEQLAENARTMERMGQETEHLGRVIQELLDSKYYRAGKALAQAKGLKGYAQLPGQLRRIAREARELEKRDPDRPAG